MNIKREEGRDEVTRDGEEKTGRVGKGGNIRREEARDEVTRDGEGKTVRVERG